MCWPGSLVRVSCKFVKKRHNFVTVEIDKKYVTSCYTSPNVHTSVFEDFLDDLNTYLTSVVGRRGTLVECWAAALDLRLLTDTVTYTCVRPQGSSIVDLTWVSPNMVREVDGWKVLEGAETLSDHRYIVFNTILRGRPDAAVARTRWNTKKMDRELFSHSLGFLANGGMPVGCGEDPNGCARWLMKIVTDACNVAIPRVTRVDRRRQVYWWSEEISELRRAALGARRAWTRERRGVGVGIELIKRRAYGAARDSLRRAIKTAKSRSWHELIKTIDKDPWDFPYKIVLGKLRPPGPTLSETLGDDPQSLSALLGSLFPNNAAGGPRPVCRPPIAWRDEQDVSYAEMYELVKKRLARNATLDPDNIKSTVWKGVPEIILAHLANIVILCLRKGAFSDMWRRAILVLIPKGNSGPGLEIKTRPICLLDEVGKTFKRVIAFRINRWMDDHPESALSRSQFGFRRDRSTVDALLRVREYTREVNGCGGFAIVVRLDIENAFNSIPWSVILEVLERRGFPFYLCAVVGSYLSGRSIQYRDSSGRVCTREVRAGVPQGSVLGPLLWNIAFDSVMAAEEGCHTICYADDTLVIATSDRLFEAIVKANLQIERVVRRISSLGFRVAESKTEAVLLCKRLSRVMPAVRVGHARVDVTTSMRYLGVIIDNKWSFRPHLKYVENKVAGVTRALSGLMPNLRGPGERKRRLY